MCNHVASYDVVKTVVENSYVSSVVLGPLPSATVPFPLSLFRGSIVRGEYAGGQLPGSFVWGNGPVTVECA